jgi:quercetin dioxygenase-like cupin family protein
MTNQTHPREERTLSAPWLLFNILDQLERLKKEPEWRTTDHNSITLMKAPGLSVVLLALKRGEVMHEHQASGPLAMQVVSGRIAVEFAGDRRQVHPGELMTVDPLVAHEVTAVEDSAILLFVGR